MKDVTVAVAQEEMANAARQVRVNKEPVVVVPDSGTKVYVTFQHKHNVLIFL